MSAALTPPTLQPFARLIDGLRRVVAEHGHRRGIPGPWLILIVTRIGLLSRHIIGLAARVATGRCRRHPGRKRPAPAPRRHARRVLPTAKPAWLVVMIQEAAPYAAYLERELATPEMAALIESAPQMRRLLRPLCRMIGARLPTPSAPPPSHPTGQATAATPPSAPPDRPRPSSRGASGGGPLGRAARRPCRPPQPASPDTPARRQSSPPAHPWPPPQRRG